MSGHPGDETPGDETPVDETPVDGTPAPGGPEPPGALHAGLRALAERGFTGPLRVAGSPGGTLHLRDGLVVAVATPGAPGPDSLLLRSGRVTERAWSAAFDAGAAAGRVGEHLVAAGAVGAGELEVVLLAALYDGVFALAVHPPDGWSAEPGPPGHPLPLDRGVHPDALLEESRRRLAALSRGWGPARRLARERPVPAAAVAPGGPRGAERDLLTLANGRRTPRDLAFLLGRGTYAVMCDVVSLAGRGLLHCRPPQPPTGSVTLTRRLPEPRGGRPQPGAPAPLPRRRPAAGPAPGNRGQGLTRPFDHGPRQQEESPR
ncbi:hypothetical protein GCM10027168_36670 [Streptomyces capparidis]